jgi:hypothetical protein
VPELAYGCCLPREDDRNGMGTGTMPLEQRTSAPCYQVSASKLALATVDRCMQAFSNGGVNLP